MAEWHDGTKLLTSGQPGNSGNKEESEVVEEGETDKRAGNVYNFQRHTSNDLHPPMAPPAHSPFSHGLINNLIHDIINPHEYSPSLAPLLNIATLGSSLQHSLWDTPRS